MGAVVLVAGIMVFFRSAFGFVVGITAAVVQAFFAFFWIFTPYWAAALVIIALDMLVIFALGTTPETPSTPDPRPRRRVIAVAGS